MNERIMGETKTYASLQSNSEADYQNIDRKLNQKSKCFVGKRVKQNIPFGLIYKEFSEKRRSLDMCKSTVKRAFFLKSRKAGYAIF